ncbi:MAG: hypothetical protein ACLQUY_05050 [Ktedonobacterales bacterium]
MEPQALETSRSTESTSAGKTSFTGDAPSTGPLAASRYRVWQFRHAVTTHQLSDEDHAVVETALPPGGQRLFASMSASDQHHSLLVYRALQNRGCTDPEMLAAALLHDSGKGSGRVPLWVRPLVVLARALTPGLLPWLARNDRAWWRRPFYYAWHHAAVGADLAARAGLSERAVLLIQTHHQPHGPAAELHAVDDAL